MKRILAIFACLLGLCTAAACAQDELLWYIPASLSATGGVELPHDKQLTVSERTIGEYTEIRPFSEGLAACQSNRRWGFLDVLGECVLRPQWEEVGDFSEGLASAKQDGLFGYIDYEGDMVIKPAFSLAGSFSEGLARARKEGLYGYIDTTGEWVIEPELLHATDFSCGYALVRRSQDEGKVAYIDRSGRALRVVEEGRPFSGNRAAVYDNGGYGFIDVNGLMIVQPVYDYVWDYSDGLAAVLLEGEIYYIDEWGNIVVHVGERRFVQQGFEFVVTPGAFCDGVAKIEITPDATMPSSYRMLMVSRNNEAILPEASGLGTASEVEGGLIRYRQDTHIEQVRDIVTYYFDNYGVMDAATGKVLHPATLGWLTPFRDGLAFSNKEADGHYWRLVFTREGRYHQAECLAAREDYERAIAAFEELGDYADARDKAEQTRREYDSVRYDKALALMQNGNYAQAIAAFEELGDYADARDKAQQAQRAYDRARYDEALAWMEAQEYDRALARLREMEGYEDSAVRAQECCYLKAELLLQQGLEEAAMSCLIEAGDYRDARQRVEDYYLSGVKEDMASGRFRQAAYKMARTGIPEYLRRAYRLRYTYLMDDRIESSGKTLVALSADGVVHTDRDVLSTGKMAVDVTSPEFAGTVAVAAAEYIYVCLKEDGTVACEALFDYAGRKHTEEWTDIVAVAAAHDHTVGLRADGTVVAVGGNTSGQCDVQDWQGVIAIDATNDATYGLLRNGTIVTTAGGDHTLTPENGWVNLVDFCIGEYGGAIGLRADGCIVYLAGRGTQIKADADRPVSVRASKTLYSYLSEDGHVELVREEDKKDIRYRGSNREMENVAALARGDTLYIVERDGTLAVLSRMDEDMPHEGFRGLCAPVCSLLAEEEWTQQVRAMLDSGAYAAVMMLLEAAKDTQPTKALYQEAQFALTGEPVQQEDAAGVSALPAEIERLTGEGRLLEAAYLSHRLGFGEPLRQAYAQEYGLSRQGPQLESDKNRTGWTLSQDGTIQIPSAALAELPHIADMNGFIACDGRYNWVAGITPGWEVYTAGEMANGGEWGLLWTDVVAIDGEGYNLIGLHSDGTVEVIWWNNLPASEPGFDTSGWTDVVAVAVTNSAAFGLRADGTVVSAGKAEDYEKTVSGWSGIVELACGPRCVVGIREDGAVVAATLDDQLLAQLEGWTDIVEAVPLTKGGVIGVKRDGTLVSAGE